MAMDCQQLGCGVGKGRTGEAGGLHADEIALDGLAQAHGGFARDVLAEEMLFHCLEGLGEVLLCQRLAADDVSEVAAYGAQTGADDAAGCCCGCLLLLCVLLLDDGVHLLVEVLEHELALVCLAAPCVLVDLLELLGLGRAVAQVGLRVVEHHVAVLFFCAQLAPCPVLLGALALALCGCLVPGGSGRGAPRGLLPVSARHLCAGWSDFPCQDVAPWRGRPRGVGRLYGRRVGACVEQGSLRRLLQGCGGRALLGAVVVDARVRGGDLDARGTGVALALQLLHLPVEVRPELVAVDDAAELRLQLLAVQADEQRAHIVEQLVDPRQVHEALVDGDEYEAEVFCLRPLHCVALLLVRGFRPAVLGLWQCALLNEDLADQAVDDIRADGDICARPQDDARGGDDLECVEHCQVIMAVGGVRQARAVVSVPLCAGAPMTKLARLWPDGRSRRSCTQADNDNLYQLSSTANSPTLLCTQIELLTPCSPTRAATRRHDAAPRLPPTAARALTTAYVPCMPA
jgi:hypothetical protein